LIIAVCREKKEASNQLLQLKKAGIAPGLFSILAKISGRP